MLKESRSAEPGPPFPFTTGAAARPADLDPAFGADRCYEVFSYFGGSYG
jgi:hypothetical protein